MDINNTRSERVVVVGSGWLFASGISHYTYRLATALADEYQVSALLMRRLVPRRLYPGRHHVGAPVAKVDYPPEIPVYDGVDWYWGRSLGRALEYLDRQSPTVMVFQWWTGAVLHSYLRLARHAAARGSRIVLEWHEGQDVGEAALPGARQYVNALMPKLLSLADAHIVHSEFDLKAITSAYTLGDVPVHVIAHGPYDHLVESPDVPRSSSETSPFRLLNFGVVRPFKGVEDLVAAFSSLDPQHASLFRLAIVGETWEGWTVPDKAISSSPHRNLIERVDRYVTDLELASYVREADGIVLPYHRSSSSGPLQIAMSAGLPVVVTGVGGLVEAVRGYRGALVIPPRDPDALRDTLLRMLSLRGERFADPHTWGQTVAGYQKLIAQVNLTTPKGSHQLASSKTTVGAPKS
jgi:glycosyltransferase involved in cell wall biosynthesis